MGPTNHPYPSGLVTALCIVYACLLSTVLMPFTIGGINYLLLAWSAVAVVSLLLIWPDQLKIVVRFPLAGMVLMFFISFMYNLGTSSLSSFSYSMYFIGCFAILAATASPLFDRRLITRIIHGVILAFLGVMLLQQAAGISGLPIPNLNPGFAPDFVEALYFFRYNALSNEPSYGATIAVVMFYFHYLLNGFVPGKYGWFYAAILYLVISFQSSTGSGLYFVLIFFLLQSRNKWWWLLLIPIALLVANVLATTRIGTILFNFDLSDPESSIVESDLSAAFRFVPNLFYLRQIDLLSADFWLGHGYGYAGNLVASYLPGIELEDKFAGGVLPSLLYDYGMLPFLAFAWFSFRVCAAGNRLFFAVLWLAVCLNANFNTQLLWLLLTFSYWVKHAMTELPVAASGKGISKKDDDAIVD